MKNFNFLTLAVVAIASGKGMAEPGGWVDGLKKSAVANYDAPSSEIQSPTIPSFEVLAQDNMEIPSAYYLNSDTQAVEFINKNGELQKILVEDINAGFWNPQ